MTQQSKYYKGHGWWEEGKEELILLYLRLVVFYSHGNMLFGAQGKWNDILVGGTVE